MKTDRQALGRWGEDLAARFLEARGYRILDHNVRTPYGEIDLIASRDDTLVFIEVKTRSSTSYGWPEAAVTPKKQAHLLKAAQDYLLNHTDLPENYRVDVIAIQQSPGGGLPDIRHFENALG
jgi:putative endonuclease